MPQSGRFGHDFQYERDRSGLLKYRFRAAMSNCAPRGKSERGRRRGEKSTSRWEFSIMRSGMLAGWHLSGRGTPTRIADRFMRPSAPASLPFLPLSLSLHASSFIGPGCSSAAHGARFSSLLTANYILLSKEQLLLLEDIRHPLPHLNPGPSVAGDGGTCVLCCHNLD